MKEGLEVKIKIFEAIKECLLPFPQRIKLWKALRWYLGANFKPYKKDRRKYCSECGWPIIYLDELYDVPIEACTPDVVAVCQFCGIEYVIFESMFTNICAVVPKRK